jgi:hypothetical protein
MSLCGASISALISSLFLGRIKLCWICSTDLTNEASNSISPIALYWSKIENMVLMLSSFMSFIRVNRTLPVKSVDGRRYFTPSTLLCLCSWVRGWFDLADSSTRRGWHHCGLYSSKCPSPHKRYTTSFNLAQYHKNSD